MTGRNTFIRTLHDVGMATWFGGSLMGVIGLNGATAEAEDPTERLRLSSLGWARWTPIQVAAIAIHAVGGFGLVLANRNRVKNQSGAGANTIIKTVVTVVAAGATAYSGLLGAVIKKHQNEDTEGATEPSPSSSDELATAQSRLKVLQWSIPLLTGTLIALGAQQGEQQREPAGLVDRIRNRS